MKDYYLDYIQTKLQLDFEISIKFQNFKNSLINRNETKTNISTLRILLESFVDFPFLLCSSWSLFIIGMSSWNMESVSEGDATQNSFSVIQ